MGVDDKFGLFGDNDTFYPAGPDFGDVFHCSLTDFEKGFESHLFTYVADVGFDGFDGEVLTRSSGYFPSGLPLAYVAEYPILSIGQETNLIVHGGLVE